MVGVKGIKELRKALREIEDKATKKGLAARALGIALVTSVIGGLTGSIVLSMSAPFLAEFAIQFSSFEYFWLACLGLSCAVIISTGSTLKGFVSLFIGLFIATIGIHHV